MLENFNTFAEINRTMEEKSKPHGSKIIGKYKVEEKINNISH